MQKQTVNTLLVDAVNLCYKYHCKPFSTFSADGVRTGTLYGVLTWLSTFKHESGCNNIVTVWDESRESLIKFGDGYKADRSERGTDIIQEVVLVRKFLSWLGVCNVSAEGYEADDLAYTYVKSSDDNIVAVSSDSDWSELLQLRSGVRLYDWRLKQYVQVPEYDVVLYKTLNGDSCDNIQRLASTPEAQLLARRCKSVHSLLKACPHIPRTDILRNYNLVSMIQVPKVSWDTHEVDTSMVKCALIRLKFQTKTIDKIITGIIQ